MSRAPVVSVVRRLVPVLLAALVLSVGLAGPASAAAPSRVVPELVTLTIAPVSGGRASGPLVVRSKQVVLLTRDRSGGLRLVTAYGVRPGLRIVNTTSVAVIVTITRARTVVSRTKLDPHRTEFIDVSS